MRGGGRWLLPVLAALLTLSLGAALPAFSDLQNHWSQPAVMALAARQVVEGFPDGTFRPGEPVTRAQVARMAVAALGQDRDVPLAAAGPRRFGDLAGHWALGWAEVAAELGLMQGYPDGRFRPDAPVTRLELAVLAARAAGLAPLAQIPAALRAELAALPGWALPEVAALAAAGLTRDGFGPGWLDAGQPATRAEAVALTAWALAHRGALFHIAGTVLNWDPQTGQVEVETPGGETVTVPTTAETVFFRNGRPERRVVPLDQIWAVLDPRGRATYVEVRYQEVTGLRAEVWGSSIHLLHPRTLEPMTVAVLPSARIFVNGRPATLAEVDGAERVYAVLDAGQGAARIVDAVQYTHLGTLRAYDPAARLITLQLAGGQVVSLPLGEDAVVYVGGQRAGLEAVAPGTRLMVYAPGGKAVFVQTDF